MRITCLLLLWVCNAFSAQPILNRITSEALAKLQSNDPLSRLSKPQPGEVNIQRPDNQSILNDSIKLHDGNIWTIVPNGAVVYIPEKLKSRITTEPTGRLTGWREFLAANYSWLSAHEMDFEQAAGKKVLPEGTPANWAKQDKIIVAVHQGGPISFRGTTDSPTSTQL